jgi:hypothetical protein
VGGVGVGGGGPEGSSRLAQNQQGKSRRALPASAALMVSGPALLQGKSWRDERGFTITKSPLLRTKHRVHDGKVRRWPPAAAPKGPAGTACWDRLLGPTASRVAPLLTSCAGHLPRLLRSPRPRSSPATSSARAPCPTSLRRRPSECQPASQPPERAARAPAAAQAQPACRGRPTAHWPSPASAAFCSPRPTAAACPLLPAAGSAGPLRSTRSPRSRTPLR